MTTSLTRRVRPAVLALALATGLTATALSGPATAAGGAFAERIPLPAGSQPEGIAGGPGQTYFAGARTDGAIVTGDLRSGQSRVLVPGQTGRIAVGMRYDRSTQSLWVAGGTTGAITEYDARTGAERFRTVVPGMRFLNDVEVTRDAIYVTDSMRAELIVVRDGVVSTLPLTGDYVQPQGFGANGIRQLATGDLVVTSGGVLYRVDPATGVADRIELTGTPLTSGDGLERRGNTLYVVYGFGTNEIAEVRLAADGRSGAVVRRIGDPDLDRPTTATLKGNRLYTVNGRFETPPTPTTPYDVIKVDL